MPGFQSQIHFWCHLLLKPWKAAEVMAKAVGSLTPRGRRRVNSLLPAWGDGYSGWVLATTPGGPRVNSLLPASARSSTAHCILESKPGDGSFLRVLQWLSFSLINRIIKSNKENNSPFPSSYQICGWNTVHCIISLILMGSGKAASLVLFYTSISDIYSSLLFLWLAW